MVNIIRSDDDLMIKYGSHSNMQGMIDDLAEEFGHRTAVKYVKNNKAVSVSMDQFYDDIRSAASELVRMGFYRKHVGVIGKNSYEWFVLAMACLYCGCVPVPFSPALRSGDVADLCASADVTALFYGYDMGEFVQQFAAISGLKTYEMKGFMDGMYIGDRVQEDGTVRNETKETDTAYIIFTSGTTGKSKGVVLPNSAFIESLQAALFKEESWLVVLPLHHIAAISVAITMMGSGAEIHIGEDPKRIIKYLELMKTTVAFVVPSLLSSVCSRLKRVGYDQSKLGWNVRLLGCGAAAFPAGTISLLKRSGMDIIQYYGATETAGGVIGGVMTEANPFTIGNLLVRHVEAKIVDHELLIKGPRILSGYYNDEESTAESITDGWYHTGDLARVDKDGYWYLTGRKKNLIILDNGENISPEEIEASFSACPDIREVIIYGKGSFLHADILPVIDNSDSVEKIEAAKNRIRAFAEKYNADSALYKRVPFIEFRETPFPKNASGKILRDQR